MSENKKQKEISDKVIKKVNKIYQNYGIDPEGLDEGDINRVYKYYANNPAQLDKDFLSSEKNPNRFGEDDFL